MKLDWGTFQGSSRQFADFLRAPSPRSRRGDKVPLIDNPIERRNRSSHVLVCKKPCKRTGTATGSFSCELCTQESRRVGIVREIQDQRSPVECPAFQSPRIRGIPTGALDGRTLNQIITYITYITGITEKQQARHQRRRCVLRGDARRRKCLPACLELTDIGIKVESGPCGRVAKPLPRQVHRAAKLVSLREDAPGHGCRSAHQGFARAQDSSFLATYGVERISKPISMFQANTRNDCDISINHIHGIEPASQANFEYPGIKLCCVESIEGGKNYVLKVGKVDFLPALIQLLVAPRKCAHPKLRGHSAEFAR